MFNDDTNNDETQHEDGGEGVFASEEDRNQNEEEPKNEGGVDGLFARLQQMMGDDGPQMRMDFYGNEFEAITYEGTDFQEFADVVLRNMYGNMFREGTPEETKKDLMDTLVGVAFVRGMYTFMMDVQKLDGRIGDVINGYRSKASSIIQDMANALFRGRDEKGLENISPGDQNIVKWLEAKGVRRMKSKQDAIKEIDEDGLVGGILQVAEALGVSKDKLDEIMNAAENGEPTPGCDCERCQEIRARQVDSPPENDEHPADMPHNEEDKGVPGKDLFAGLPNAEA